MNESDTRSADLVGIKPTSGRGAVRLSEWCIRASVQGLWIAAALLSVGCATGLPRIRPESLNLQTCAIPAGASPVYAWRASRQGLRTYWDEQAVSIQVRGYLPATWQQPGDGFWQVEAHNHEGKPIPFLGVVRPFVNEHGTRLAEVVPKFSLDALPDGLYLVLVPGVTDDGDKIVAIAPAILLREIRDHVWKPFSLRIPLVPDQDSPLTPAPAEPSDHEPEGTPIPVN